MSVLFAPPFVPAPPLRSFVLAMIKHSPDVTSLCFVASHLVPLGGARHDASAGFGKDLKNFS